jgi:hypothetical protein
VARVSDHAVLRYLERVKHVDIEAIRRDISVSADKAISIGCDTVKMGDGTRLKLKGSTVVTVLDKRAAHFCHGERDG